MKKPANYALLTESLLVVLYVYGALSVNITDKNKDACGKHPVCDCYTKQTLKYVNCEKRNLTALPNGIMSDVNIIILASNNIYHLKSDSFMRQSALLWLDIFNNRLEKLPKDLLFHTAELMTLDLSANKLRSLDKDFFSSLFNLKTLDISRNRLRELPKGLLFNTTRLTKLDLLGNKLRSLDKDFFLFLFNLKTLILSRNNLISIADNLFSNLINLEILKMGYNNLHIKSLNFIRNLTNLKELYASDNRITTLRAENFQGLHSLNILCISSNNMFIQSTLLLSSLITLQMLHLSSNKIGQIPSDSFSNFSAMQVLKLANSTLEDIPDHLFVSMSFLRELNLEDNFLKEIRLPHFAYLAKLIFLTLSNNKIQTIEGGSFKNLTNIYKIDLRKNNLKALPEGLFAHSNHLVILHLENNKLVALPTTLFGQSSELQELYLSGNNIVTVPERSISSLPFLNHLDLSGNHIEEFSEGTFSNLTSLKLLRLSNNNLEYLPSMIFAPLEKLTSLHLDGNNLKELSNSLFLKLENLYVLLLRANSIYKVPKDLLISQGKLRKIDLSYNAVIKVPENMLPVVHYLEDMDLSFNNLRMLPYNFLDSARKIGTLHLSQNSIENITKENFGSLEEAENLYLSRNQLLHLPEDLFSEVQISNTLDLSNNRITELRFGLFNSNNKTHGLQTLLLQRNFLTHLPANIFKGLKNLKSICLFYNNIQHLADSAFENIGVERIYLFGNNLSVFADGTFDNKYIQEIHLYRNDITYLSGTALAGLDKTTKVFIDCEQLEEVLRTSLYITCVTPQYVPNLRVNSNLMSSFEHEGFHCSNALPICDCSPCPRGTYGDGEQFCLPCPPGGFYQDDIGTVPLEKSKVCKRCRNGTYVEKGGAISIADCIVCPDGTKKDVHAGYRACFCEDNYARIDRFGPCFVCQEKGVTCLEDYKSLSSGFSWNWNFQNANLSRYRLFVYNLKIKNESFDTNTAYNGQIPRVYRCPRRESCKNNFGDIEARCSKGYRGWLCNKCEANFYSVMNYCLPCPAAIVLIIEVLLVIAFCIAVSIVILRRQKSTISSGKTNRSVTDIVMSRAKITLGFYQVLGEFLSSLHDVNWSGALRYVGQLISYIQLNIFMVFIRPQCFHEKLIINPKLEFIIGMIFICAVLILSILLYQTMRLWYRLTEKGTASACTTKIRTKLFKSQIITCVIILLFVTYPPLCTMIFQLYPQACEMFCFDVTNRECVTVLRSDFDLNCKELRIYNAFAYVATVGYVLAFPFTLFLWLRVILRSNLSTRLHTSYSTVSEENDSEIENSCDEAYKDESKNPMWVDFLCENYKPHCWYWEILELVRKATQAFIITLLGWEDRLTVLVTIGISVLFLTLHARYMPMKSSFEQYLQMFSLTAILVNVLVAAMGTPDEFGGALSYVLVVLNVALITIIAGEIVVRLLIRLGHLRNHEAISRCCVLTKVQAVNVYRRMTNLLSHENQVCNDESSTSFTE